MSAPIPTGWGGRPDPNASPMNGRVLRLGEVAPIEPQFVERPLIQAATFHLLAARPETGKGVLCTRWIARCTNGDMYGKPKNALWLSSEEDPARDLRPRLDVAGADVERVIQIPNEFRLPRDIEWLRDYAANVVGNVGLIVLDPLSNHIGTANSNADEEVRLGLQPLAILAGQIDVPIIGARHVSTKEASSGFIAKILGSTAWVAVPRVVIGAAHDEEGVVHVRVVKGNRVRRDEAGVQFTIDSAPYLNWRETVPVAVDQGESRADIDSLLKGGSGRESNSKSEEARTAIVNILRAHGGQLESDALDAKVAEEAGVAARTVRNLRGELRDRGWLRAYPEREGDKITRWMISLTNAAPYTSELEPSRARSHLSRALAEISHVSTESFEQDTLEPPDMTARALGTEPPYQPPLVPSKPGEEIGWEETPPQ